MSMFNVLVNEIDNQGIKCHITVKADYFYLENSYLYFVTETDDEVEQIVACFKPSYWVAVIG